MSRIWTVCHFIAFSLILGACAHQDNSSIEGLRDSVSGSHRTKDFVARDKYRNPLGTLTFFEVEPHMTVIEIFPGRGWYTEILAPYLKQGNGQLILAIFDDKTASGYRKTLNQELRAKIEGNPEVFDEVKFTTFDPPKKLGPLAEPNSVDRILTFRSVHSMMSAGEAQKSFESFYKALKPGGLLGVVTHKSKLTAPQDPKAKSGYVQEQFVIDLAQAAGFEFVASSEVNANPKDSTDHPEGVWSLPPSLRLKEKNREAYERIGESHRMTLKFKK